MKAIEKNQNKKSLQTSIQGEKLPNVLLKTGFQEKQETCIKITPKGMGMCGVK